MEELCILIGLYRHGKILPFKNLRITIKIVPNSSKSIKLSMIKI